MVAQSEFQGLVDSAYNHYNDNLTKEIAELLTRLKLTVSVAESLTGGMLGQHLTSVPGSSEYFMGGVISYTTNLKIKLLGVSPLTIREKGEVSSQTALEMVEGLQRLIQSDVCLSTTGVAGPANKKYSSDATGKVFIGFLHQKSKTVKHYRFQGTRHNIREKTTVAALELLRQYLATYQNQKKGEN